VAPSFIFISTGGPDRYVTLISWFDAGFSLNKLMNRTLYMQVLDYDRFSRDDPIGEVCIPISEIDLSTSQTLWRNLQPCKGHSVST